MDKRDILTITIAIMLFVYVIEVVRLRNESSHLKKELFELQKNCSYLKCDSCSIHR
jgi:hypothetical protein